MNQKYVKIVIFLVRLALDLYQTNVNHVQKVLHCINQNVNLTPSNVMIIVINVMAKQANNVFLVKIIYGYLTPVLSQSGAAPGARRGFAPINFNKKGFIGL